jgi:hypothetical protein
MSSMVPIALSHGDGAPGAGRRWGRVEGQEDAECSDRRCHGFEKGKLYYEEPRKYCIANDFAFGICYPELGHTVFVLTFIFYFSATGPKGLPWRMADISRSIAVFVNTTHQRNWCSRCRLLLYSVPMRAEHSFVFAVSGCVSARRECATLRALRLLTHCAQLRQDFHSRTPVRGTLT